MYLVLKGTTVRVRKPNGTMVEHVMKRNVVIPGGQATIIGYDLHFPVGGYTIIIRADLAEYAKSQCPECKRDL